MNLSTAVLKFLGLPRPPKRELVEQLRCALNMRRFRQHTLEIDNYEHDGQDSTGQRVCLSAPRIMRHQSAGKRRDIDQLQQSGRDRTAKVVLGYRWQFAPSSYRRRGGTTTSRILASAIRASLAVTDRRRQPDATKVLATLVTRSGAIERAMSIRYKR